MNRLDLDGCGILQGMAVRWTVLLEWSKVQCGFNFQIPVVFLKSCVVGIVEEEGTKRT